MFESYFSASMIPKNGNILARVSDNVLEDSDWGVYKLSLKNGVVRKQKVASPGVYVATDFVGMCIEQLSEWSCHDSTGRHPENYHELEVLNDD